VISTAEGFPSFGQKTCRELFYSALENALPPETTPYSAHAEAEDGSKIKDHLEALLCAETLQGTLSPNANPERGQLEAF